MNKEISIWAIGHAGHDEPKTELGMEIPKLKNNKHLYDLNGQLQHKIKFIDFIPDQIKNIYVIGHSVGAKLILDLLKSSPKFNEKVSKCYLMFPTIEKIALSSNGKIFTKLTFLFFLARIILLLFNTLPLSFRKRLVKFFCKDIPDEFHEACLEYTKTSVLEKVFFMALDEMEKITDYDEELIRNNLHRLKLYYGRTDGWVRKRYYYDIIKKFPEIDAELCNKNYDHAFVIKSGVECGVMVGEWIKESMNEQIVDLN